MKHADVLVIGGGAAGIAAAIAAARAGAEVILVESASALGGMGSTALVHTFCGLYEVVSDPAQAPQFSNLGLTQELVARMQAVGACAEHPTRMGKLEVLFHTPKKFARVSEAWLQSFDKVELFLNAKLVALKRLAARHWVARMERAQGEFEIGASVVIDASGDAVATTCCGAGYEMEVPERLQRSAMIVQLRGVSEDALSSEKRLQLASRLVRAVKSEALPPAVLGAGFRVGLGEQTAFLTLDLSATLLDDERYLPLDDAYLKRLEGCAKEVIDLLLAWLPKEVDGWELVEVAEWPRRLGIRETRRGAGIISLELDAWRRESFEDAVGFATWPIELREKATGPTWQYPESAHRPQIPLRALVSREFPDLLFAGRCVSCSHEVLGSLRVMGTCLVTGEAAGYAAALLQKSPSLTTSLNWNEMAARIGDFKKRRWGL